MAKVRSKREAERLAYDEARQRRQAEFRAWMQAPGEGYASVGPLALTDPVVCLRCSALIFGKERHDAWHESFLTVGERPSYSS